jgi:hypothetical protein
MIYGYTDNFSIPLSSFDTPAWVDEDHSRWRLIDALIAAVDNIDVPFVAATGSVNAFVAAYSPAITAYTAGLVLQFKANEAVTGPSTLNVNGLGAKTLKMNGSDTVTGDIPDEAFVRVIYDGESFAVIDPKKPVNSNQNIIAGDSGATANAATDFYVESSGPTYVELLGPNASTQGFMFSRPALSYAGGMKYDHVNELLILRVGGNDVWSCDEDGFVTAAKFIGAFQGNLSGNVTGNVSGTAASWSASRTLTLGTDASGNVAFNGSADFTLNLTIVNNAITNAKLADMAAGTIKGRITGSGDPQDLTGTEATGLLTAFSGDGGAGGVKGIVPAPAAGDAAKGAVLQANGTWGSEIKALACVTGATGVIVSGRNLACTRVGAGDYDFTFLTALASANYIITLTIQTADEDISHWIEDGTKTAAGFTVKVITEPGDVGYDPTQLLISVLSV